MNNPTPHISLKPLAEFINASLSRKRSILRTIKSSKPEDMAKKVKYNEAKSSIRIFMTDDEHKIDIFQNKYSQVENKETNSDTQRTNKRNTLEAIKKLKESAQSDFIPYLQYKSENGSNYTAKKNIEGVLVHFSPDLILKEKTSDKIVGAIKLIFTKTPIPPLQGEVISGLLKMHIENTYKVKIELKNCFALDVFAKRSFISPSEFNYYSRLLKKAYSEINDLWYKV